MRNVAKGKATEKNPLGFLYQSDTLILTARFSECGEFGGHNEKIIFYCNYKREYFVRFTKDSIDIECPIDFEEKAIIVKDTMLTITPQKEKLVLKYLNKLYKRSITNKPIFDAADCFNAKSRKFVLRNDEKPNSWKEFRKLQIDLIR